MTGTNSKRRSWRHKETDRGEQIMKALRNGTKNVSVDADALIASMLENVRSVVSQVLLTADEDSDDFNERLFYVNGAVTGMINMLVACGVLDRSTADEIHALLEDGLLDNW